MKGKLKYLIGVSLKKKIKTKWFLIANIVIALVVIGIMNIDSIITFFGGDFENSQKVFIKDETQRSYDILKAQLEMSNFELISDDDQTFTVEKYEADDVEEFLKEEKKAIVIELTEDEKLKANIISESLIETIDYQLIMNALNNTKTSLNILDSNISEEQLQKLNETIEVERTILDEKHKSDDENASLIMTTVFPFLILPFFMLSLFLVQMIGAEVNDEKTTRGMEIIISNVSPKTHFASKAIAGNIFVLFQGTLLIIYAALGFLIRNLIGGNSIANGIGSHVGEIINQITSSSIGGQLVFIIPLALILMILTFVGYSVLAGVLASMTTNTEDFQQLQTPIVVISMVGYYLATMSSVFNGALFIKIFSFVPFISAILAPSLLLLEQISVVEMIISIIIMIITNYLLIKYGMRIYKVGILNYSSKGLWKKMFKAAKNK